MPKKKKTANQETSEPLNERVSFEVAPGTKVQITVEVGEKLETGKVPLTVHIEQAAAESTSVEKTVVDPVREPMPRPIRAPIIKTEKLKAGFEALQSRLKAYDLATWLFFLALGL